MCPSRALDARIYCAIHGVTDANELSTAAGIEARAQGAVLLFAPGVRGWVSTPRFTSDLDCAKSLLPSGVLTISRDPMIVCSTALAALAMTQAPAHGWHRRAADRAAPTPAPRG